jgi:UDP-N-acetyl-D-mannosaminuronic acid dehydrogenase
MMAEKIGVIGLGYIGLPLLASLAESGFNVIGMDIDQDKVGKLKRTLTADIYEPGLNEALNRHKDSIEFTDSCEFLMQQCSTILVTVGTPLDEKAIPDINSIHQVTSDIGGHLRKGHLIILKSTVYPGLTRQMAVELEEVSGLKAGSDFYIAFHPERTIEGAALSELYALPKIIGGLNAASTERAASVIQKLGGEIIRVSSPEVAELCKLIDNTYRMANIAFANEIGDICEKFGVDPYEVRTVVNNAYDRTRLFQPGLGADGPCLSKDPQILQYYANERSVNTRVIDACIIKGSESTLRVARIVAQYLIERKIRRPKVSLIGLAFKGTPETDDTRDAPAVKVQNALKKTVGNIEFSYYDPIVKEFLSVEVSPTLAECMRDADVVVFLTNPPDLMGIDIEEITAVSSRPLLVVDCWRNIGNPEKRKKGVQIYRLGSGML